MGVINNEVAALKRKAAADGRFDGSDRSGNQSTCREFYRLAGSGGVNLNGLTRCACEKLIAGSLKSPAFQIDCGFVAVQADSFYIKNRAGCNVNHGFACDFLSNKLCQRIFVLILFIRRVRVIDGRDAV